MIHEVRLPRETKIYLWQVVRLQLDVLSCAVNLSPGFTQSDMQSVLENKMLSARAERVAKWIFEHKAPKEALLKFAKGSNPERQALFDSMRRDIFRLFWGRRDETLERCFGDDKKLPDYQKGAKDFLIAFYEQLGSGVDANLFARNPYQHRKYGREIFFAAYERENPTQHVCAICDEHRPITILRGEYFSDIEHYFPKSVYPHLACHPYNLIPMCKPCNSAHGIKDPLASTPRRTLGKVFLPYRNESVRLQGTVKFEWNKPQSPALSINERQINPNNAFRAKLEAFAEVYNIPGRWQDRIHQIGEQLWRQMSYYARVEIDKEEALDVFKTRVALERLLNYFVEDLGATPWDYVLIWYLSHLLVTEIEEAIDNNQNKDKVALVVSLEDIIKNQLSVYTPKLRAEEVLITARRLYTHE